MDRNPITEIQNPWSKPHPAKRRCKSTIMVADFNALLPVKEKIENEGRSRSLE